MEPETALRELFAAETIAPERFAPSFLLQLPTAAVARIVDGLKESHGALLAVEAAGDGYRLRFAEAEVPARIALDDEGRIVGLWFGAAQAAGALADLAATVGALPERSALLVVTEDEVIASINAEQPLAVGSAAKLAVLCAVLNAVEEGRLAWDEVVTLDSRWKSLPSGQLQDWPASTPVTIATLANLMISISDNTATDALIHLVGRRAVEAVSPRNTPFPTTREFFMLKADEVLREAWVQGDAAARRRTLHQIADAPLPPVVSLLGEVTAEVEWFMTARELCDLLEATTAAPSLGISPGPIDPSGWQAVAYKGGSEPGVLNLSVRLTDRDDRTHCVVTTWNAGGVLDEARLVTLFRGIVGRLAKAD